MSSSLQFAREVPAIETERLKLRGHRMDDFSDCAAMWGDPVVTRYVGGKPFSGEEVWARMLRYVGHWSWMGFGHWAVEEKATGNFVGELGFGDFKRDIEPSFNGVPEVGWVLVSRVHGKGYATEGVRAALAWGEERFGLAQTACIIHPENLPSIRVAEKCGFREFQRTVYKNQPTILFFRQVRSDPTARSPRSAA
ncbi:MAG TPA: GNAT family N-acetyltransferase [Bryobacteraceae bacterium]|nr:GNAT family N-acetyltransferase [Bryobacteraceae bacterium]